MEAHQEELIREIFTHFGVAYYHSEVLHRGLCIMYALMTFDKSEDITSPRVEEKLALAFSLTLGQIARKAIDLLPNNLRQQLEVALEKRNYLAHRFWFERCHLLFNRQGLLELSQELLELSDLFSKLDQEITAYFKPTREAFGINDELIHELTNSLVAGEPEEPLISQRFPKKQEHIVKVWDIKVANGLTTQIFESEDGCLWQFCDVGLGWTRFEKPAPDWTINKRLQEHLPAQVNPRPPITEPWNYEFHLAKETVLWVKQGNRERTYIWGIKTPPKP